MGSTGTSSETIQVDIPGNQTVTVIRDRPVSNNHLWMFVYAPGAGSNINDPFGSRLSSRLTEHGVITVRFQFPYMEANRRRPDRPEVLEGTWRQVMDVVRDDHLKLAVGGRSMGGRIASQVVAGSTCADALVLFAYPLRPPNNPTKVRDSHFCDLRVPTLFCSGTRDTFGSPIDLAAAASKVPNSKLLLLEGADHGFNLLKSAGRTREQVWDKAISKFTDWLRSI